MPSFLSQLVSLPWMKYAWFCWVLLSVIACSYLAYALTVEKGSAKRIFLPGETTHGHYQIELDCHACHTTSWEMKQDSCITCHGEELKESRDTHPSSKFNDPVNAERLALLDAQNCLTCHKEHVAERTHPMGLSLPTDYCFHCHQDVAEQRPSHKDFGYNSCATAGCHNYHDNTALYENFLHKHFGEPDVLANPVVPQRNYHEVLAEDENLGPPLDMANQDGPKPEPSQRQLYDDWAETAHAAAGVNCSACHQPHQEDSIATQWSNQVPQTVCGTCHEPEQQTWLKGKHGMRIAQGLPPMTPGEAKLPMHHNVRHEQLSCNSCHEGHRFDTKTAAVESCLKCHNDSHSLAYQQSSHYQLWKDELSGKAAPGSGVSCATCHMPREDNSKLDRVVVNHNQNANLEPNEKMLRSVCMNCHGLEYSINALADDQLINQCFDGLPEPEIESMQMVKEWFDKKEREKQERINRRKTSK